MADKGLFEQLNSIGFIELDGLLGRWKGWHENIGLEFNIIIISIVVVTLIGLGFFASGQAREEAQIAAAQANGTWDPVGDVYRQMDYDLRNDPSYQANKAVEAARIQKAEDDIRASGGFVYEAPK